MFKLNRRVVNLFTKLILPFGNASFLESSLTSFAGHLYQAKSSGTRISRLALVAVVLAHFGLVSSFRHQLLPEVEETQARPIMVSLISEQLFASTVPSPAGLPFQAHQKPIRHKAKSAVNKKERPKPKPAISNKSSANQTRYQEKNPQPSTPEKSSAAPIAPASYSESSAHALEKRQAGNAGLKFQAPSFNASYLHNPPPSYPSVSRRLREQGRVFLTVMVTADGVALSVALNASSGSTRLDEAAIAAVRKWRFVPARRSGQAVSASVIVPIKFSLEG